MNCKQGDLAYIRKALRQVNIGKIVTVKLLLGSYSKDETYLWNGEMFHAYDTDVHWVIESQSGIETQYGPSREAVIMDSWLIPIRGDNLELDEKIKELDLVK